jgi:predicted AAA+ superfamily ATPase
VESLRRYLFVGGMPAAVGRYADTSDFGEVRAVQRQIIDSYYADFAKHIPSDCIARTRELWDSVPAQLAKENKRFLYSDMKKGSRGRAYEAALNWLTQTNLIRRLHRVSLPNIPLAGYRQANIFKIYMTDIGLLSARIGVDPRLYLDGDAAFSHYKGGLAEQFVLQELIAADDTLPVFYWATDKNTAEIEFVLQCEDVVPVEVKSGTHVASESLRAYRDKFRPARAVRASLKKFGLADGLCSVPLYMMGDIQRLLKVLRF